MLQLLISWKHITHPYDKKTNYSYCVGALGAFLSLPASCHPPETRCLLSSDYSLFLPPIKTLVPSCPTTLSLSLSVYSCLFSLPRGSLRLFRQDLSSSVELQSAHHSAGCLERLTMTNQTLQTFNWSLYPTNFPRVIQCPQTPPLPHLWLRRFNRRLPIFSQQGHRFSIINAHFHHCLGCLGSQSLPSLTLASLSCVSAFIFAEGCFPHSLLTGHRKHASLVRCWWRTTDKLSNWPCCMLVGAYKAMEGETHTHTHKQAKLQRGLC